MAKIKNALSSEIVKEYGIDAGASVVGIAASKDFSLALFLQMQTLLRIKERKLHCAKNATNVLKTARQRHWIIRHYLGSKNAPERCSKK